MSTVHIKHVRAKITYLLHSLMFVSYILSILSQAVEIVHGEDLTHLVSSNHGQYLNQISRQHSRQETTRCIWGGSHLISLNLSQLEINSGASSVRAKLAKAVLKRLFQKHGQNNDEMSIRGLENLLTNIHLVGHRGACEDSSGVSGQKTELPSSPNFSSSSDRKRSVDDRRTGRSSSRRDRRSTIVEDLHVNSEGDVTLESASEAVDHGNAGGDWNSDVSAKVRSCRSCCFSCYFCALRSLYAFYKHSRNYNRSSELRSFLILTFMTVDSGVQANDAYSLFPLLTQSL